MRGRIPYVTIMGYISPTFIKILVDHVISQTRPYFFFNCTPISFFAAFYMNNDNSKKKEDLGTRLGVTHVL